MRTRHGPVNKKLAYQLVLGNRTIITYYKVLS